MYCPYCGSKNVKSTDHIPMIDGTYTSGYACNDCLCLFDEEDIEREALRHQLSPMLDDYEDMNPDNKEIIIHWDEVEKVKDEV